MPSIPTPVNQSNPYEKIRNDSKRIARMQFPLDMGRYYIAFEFAEYGPSYSSGASDFINLPGVSQAVDTAVGAINALSSRYGFERISMDAVRQQSTQYGIGSINAAIALPMPPNLVDDQQLDYNAQNLLNVAAQAASASAQAAGGYGSGAAQTVGSIVNVGQALTNFQSVFTGQTVNPFLAMMFNGPRFKTHQFGWRFSPKTAQETAELMKIINTFKSKSLPLQHGQGAVFKYPDVCLISLYPSNARELMYKFKPAVITQISAHYAPSGTPSFFAGTNGPAEIELKIQLSEISIWTKTDIPDYSRGN
jgi:hypothetical protein